MAVMIGIDPHKGSHAAVAVGAAETRTCLLVQARSQHDFAKSARRRGSPETVETFVMRILLWPALSLAL